MDWEPHAQHRPRRQPGCGLRSLLRATEPHGGPRRLYRRTVAEVLRDGQNVNVQMLRQCDAATYLGAERAAEIDRVGVWTVPGGIIRPWDFRRQRRR